MRLLVVTSSFPADDHDSRNAGVFVANAAQLLVEAGDDVTVVSPHASTVTGAFEVRSFPRLGGEASLSHLDARSAWGLLQLGTVLLGGLVVVPLLVARRRSQHVVAMWAVPSGVFALVARRLLGRKYTVWVLGSDVWRVRDYPGGPWLLRRVLRGAERVYADGYRLAREAAAVGGVEVGFLATSRTLPAPAARLWNDGNRHVVAFARFHEHKGVDVLVEAVGLLPAEVRVDLVVHVWGSGPQAPLIEGLVSRFGLEEVVVLEGLADEQLVADALGSADLAVVPSRLESIPLVLSDICQVGTPLVVTDAGDMGEVVATHGAGRVVPTGDAAALSEAIAEELAGEHHGTAEGRRRLARHLSLAASVDALRAGMARRDAVG